jgi:hypothetical protein
MNQLEWWVDSFARFVWKESQTREGKMKHIVTASPGKAFFVEMLTRDIELKNAILDLLDNCIDGILRQFKNQRKEELLKSDKPYDGYWAKITANPTKFSIEDNCGGIPMVKHL